MTCSDHENRPTVCRSFTCEKECDNCGTCCSDVALTFDGVISGDAEGFLLLHGVSIEYNDDNYTLVFPLPCRNYVTKEA